MKAILSTKVYLLAPLFWLLVFTAGGWHNCQHSNPSNMTSLDSLDNSADMSAESDDDTASADDGVGPTDRLHCEVNEDAPPREKYENCIVDAGRIYQVRPALIWAVIRSESMFKPKSYIKVSGASGLMGVVHASCNDSDVDLNLFDPQTNIECGTRVLASMIAKQNGDERTALMVYVAGSERVKSALTGANPLPKSVIDYATRILDLADAREHDLATRKWFMEVSKSGTYRSFSTQASVFCTGDPSVTKPGESRHQYGKAVDLQGVVDEWGNNVDLPPTGHTEAGATKIQTMNLERLYRAMNHHGFLGKVGAEWSHFDFHGEKKNDLFLLPPLSFNCRDWADGRIKAPPQPEGLETWGINHVSKELTLTAEAHNALRLVNAELTRDR